MFQPSPFTTQYYLPSFPPRSFDLAILNTVHTVIARYVHQPATWLRSRERSRYIKTALYNFQSYPSDSLYEPLICSSVDARIRAYTRNFLRGPRDVRSSKVAA